MAVRSTMRRLTVLLLVPCGLGGDGFEQPAILAGRDADEHLLDRAVAVRVTG